MLYQDITVNNRNIGPGHPCLIIAEIGSNHDGNLKAALSLIDAAAASGVDAVKFQSFSAEGLLNPLRYSYNKQWETEPAYHVLEKLSLPDEWQPELKARAEKKGLIYLCTPFETAKIEILEKIGVEAYKIASGDLTYYPLLEAVARTGKPIFLSTGMATLDEVQEAIDRLNNAGNSKIILLHGVGLYPPAPEQLNLRAIPALLEATGLPVGYSDHMVENQFALSAVALGACCLEKHFTLSRRCKGPDHGFSQEPKDFTSLATQVRILETALGQRKKQPAEGEENSLIGGRRGIYAARNISRGEIISPDDLKVVRPAIPGSLAPKMLSFVIGRQATRDLANHQPLNPEDFA